MLLLLDMLRIETCNHLERERTAEDLWPLADQEYALESEPELSSHLRGFSLTLVFVGRGQSQHLLQIPVVTEITYPEVRCGCGMINPPAPMIKRKSILSHYDHKLGVGMTRKM